LMQNSPGIRTQCSADAMEIAHASPLYSRQQKHHPYWRNSRNSPILRRVTEG
jgi:hypothetical protein